MKKTLYIIKRYLVDVLLIISAILMLIFCCDAPVVAGFEIFDHTGKDFWYDLFMAALTAILFYFLQKNHTYFARKRKYEKIVFNRCQDVALSIQKICWIITRERDYKKITLDLLQTRLKGLDYAKGSSLCFLNNVEMTMKEALSREDIRLLQRVDTALTTPFLDDDLLDILHEIKNSNLHRIWEEMFENDNGKLETIAQKEGTSFGGSYCHADNSADIAKELYNCINKIREMECALKVVQHYTEDITL